MHRPGQRISFLCSLEMYIIRSALPKQAHNKMIDRVKFECKREIATITQQGHLKDMEPIAPRDLIKPSRIGQIIPHLPEECSQ